MRGVLSSVALVTCLGNALATLPTITIESGVVIGTTTTVPSGTAVVKKFLGIPFAKSPPLRFAPPEDPPAWSEPLDACDAKPICLQQWNYPDPPRSDIIRIFNNPYGGPLNESEDCLYINVYTPATEPPLGGRAVLFWIYGGELQAGGSTLAVYDGSFFAAYEDVIVVVANYRTNVFGYSGSPEIPQGQQNVGFLDQRKALEWVQKNIASFGGDPKKVTIFGESAGGYSVRQLLAAPPSPLTFRAAIAESAGPSRAPVGTTTWEQLVMALNCSSNSSQIECVRSRPATTIVSIIEHDAMDFAPAYDNVTCVQDIRAPIKSKQLAHVPFMTGTNANEGRVFVYLEGIDPGAGEAQLDAFLNATFPDNTTLQQAVVAAYPAWLTENIYELIGQIYTDLTFTCTTSSITNLAETNGYDVWRYYYNTSFPNVQFFPDSGAFHTSEVPEVFGTYLKANASEQQIKLSRYMQKTWANFAKNPIYGPGWPKLGTNDGIELEDIGVKGIFGGIPIPVSEVDHICAVYAPIIATESL